MKYAKISPLLQVCIINNGDFWMGYNLESLPKRQMADITTINSGEVLWDSTNGNTVTFRITANIGFVQGQEVVKTQHTEEVNHHFPTDIPELHYHIADQAGGADTIMVSELISVVMDHIHTPVTVKLVVKEDGNVKKTQQYIEDEENLQR